MLAIRKWWNSSRTSKSQKERVAREKGRKFEEWEREELLGFFERFREKHGEKPHIWIVGVGKPHIERKFWYVGRELPSWIRRREKDGTYKTRATNRRMVFRYPSRSKETCLYGIKKECKPRGPKGRWFKLKDFSGSVQKAAGLASATIRKWSASRAKRGRSAIDPHVYRVHYRVTGLTFGYYVTMEPLVVDESKWFWKWFGPVELTLDELRREIVR